MDIGELDKQMLQKCDDLGDGARGVKKYIKLRLKKIESLQSQLTDLKEERDSLKNKLLATRGKKIICRGVGQCDYDGSTCNENDNCGEYDPVVVELGE